MVVGKDPLLDLIVLCPRSPTPHPPSTLDPGLRVGGGAGPAPVVSFTPIPRACPFVC